MRVYGMYMSGNCWKVSQILALTGRAFDWVETDGNAGATRTPEYLAINPNGKVPAVVLDDGVVLTESNAILLHFAEGTAWLPAPGLLRTRVCEWLFFEQYSHEPYIAVARNLRAWKREAHLHGERLAECARRGADALDVMERRLGVADWLVGDGPTAADLALFAYTHRADEGGFDLARWPGVGGLGAAGGGVAGDDDVAEGGCGLMTPLRLLEAESIGIIREAAAECRAPVRLHLAVKAFRPGPLPFPLPHIDTGLKFREIHHDCVRRAILPRTDQVRP